VRAVAGVMYAGNGPIDFARMKAAGIDAVILKALGDEGEDRLFKVHAKAARAAGLPWTAGVWPNPIAQMSAKVQAETFWYVANSAAGRPDFPLSLDLEEAPSGLNAYQLAGFYRALIDSLRALGADCHIYTLDNFWNSRVAPAGVDFTDCTLRTADYRGRTKTNPSRPVPPTDPDAWPAWLASQSEPEPDAVVGFPTWDAWQFSADGNGLGATYGLVNGGSISLNVVKDSAWDRWFPPPPPPHPAEIELDLLRGQLADLARFRRVSISARNEATVALNQAEAALDELLDGESP
jgi:GH25 family lysozyme M1 (1,4-beta-N-acetylmuramidase)